MKEDQKTDAELVVAYQLGDKLALASLVSRWHLLFCKKAYWLVKNKDLSKDIAQDTWQTIIQKIDTLKDTNRFGSWALQIVYSKSLDALRKISSERNKLNAYGKELPSLDLQYDEKGNLKKELLNAVYNLPEQQQAVIKLFYVQDYSLKEISKILEISVGTAKSRLFYGREKIKQLLKTKNYEK